MGRKGELFWLEKGGGGKKMRAETTGGPNLQGECSKKVEWALRVDGPYPGKVGLKTGGGRTLAHKRTEKIRT